MYFHRPHCSVSCESETSTASKRSLKTVVFLPTRRAIGRIYRALVTGFAISPALPRPKTSNSMQQQLLYDSPPPMPHYPAFRPRESDEWSDEDRKTRHRLAKFFPQYEPVMEGYKSLPADLAIKLAVADKRFSMESQRSSDGRRRSDSTVEMMANESVCPQQQQQQKRRDSGLSVNLAEEDVRVAKAVSLRRAVRTSFYPPPRPGSK